MSYYFTLEFLKRKNRKYCTFNELNKICVEGGFLLDSNSEVNFVMRKNLQDFLQYFHEIGEFFIPILSNSSVEYVLKDSDIVIFDVCSFYNEVMEF